MYLSPDQQRRSNKQRELILKHCVDHRLCNGCNGTGLGNVSHFDGDYSWDGETFCDKCEGSGYLDFKETMIMKLCPYCKGGGLNSNSDEKCSKCNGEGILDWIQYMRLGGKNNGK